MNKFQIGSIVILNNLTQEEIDEVVEKAVELGAERFSGNSYRKSPIFRYLFWDKKDGTLNRTKGLDEEDPSYNTDSLFSFEEFKEAYNHQKETSKMKMIIDLEGITYEEHLVVGEMVKEAAGLVEGEGEFPNRDYFDNPRLRYLGIFNNEMFYSIDKRLFRDHYEKGVMTAEEVKELTKGTSKIRKGCYFDLRSVSNEEEYNSIIGALLEAGCPLGEGYNWNSYVKSRLFRYVGWGDLHLSSTEDEGIYHGNSIRPFGIYSHLVSKDDILETSETSESVREEIVKQLCSLRIETLKSQAAAIQEEIRMVEEMAGFNNPENWEVGDTVAISYDLARDDEDFDDLAELFTDGEEAVIVSPREGFRDEIKGAKTVQLINRHDRKCSVPQKFLKFIKKGS